MNDIYRIKWKWYIRMMTMIMMMAILFPNEWMNEWSLNQIQKAHIHTHKNTEAFFCCWSQMSGTSLLLSLVNKQTNREKKFIIIEGSSSSSSTTMSILIFVKIVFYFSLKYNFQFTFKFNWLMGENPISQKKNFWNEMDKKKAY